ncbi:MAG: DUF1566 domain-containing protein [Crocinitomicaceae bacterium]|nr:DUF1566 domain-containing protein [Crocinitomicaceae bacterium]
MKNLNYAFSIAAVAMFIAAQAQVEVDKTIDLTGADGQRMLTNLEAPVNPTDAVNKEYVDAAVAASGGANFTMISNESSTSMNLKNALAYCRNLNESSYSDWQMPTQSELFVLLSKGGNNLVIPNPDSNNFFWVLEPLFTSNASYMMGRIRLSDYYFTTAYTSPPDGPYYVRCIR